jgi:hypothetical protein
MRPGQPCVASWRIRAVRDGEEHGRYGSEVGFKGVEIHKSAKGSNRA